MRARSDQENRSQGLSRARASAVYPSENVRRRIDHLSVRRQGTGSRRASIRPSCPNEVGGRATSDPNRMAATSESIRSVDQEWINSPPASVYLVSVPSPLSFHTKNQR